MLHLNLSFFICFKYLLTTCYNLRVQACFSLKVLQEADNNTWFHILKQKCILDRNFATQNATQCSAFFPWIGLQIDINSIATNAFTRCIDSMWQRGFRFVYDWSSILPSNFFALLLNIFMSEAAWDLKPFVYWSLETLHNFLSISSVQQVKPRGQIWSWEPKKNEGKCF